MRPMFWDKGGSNSVAVLHDFRSASTFIFACYCLVSKRFLKIDIEIKGQFTTAGYKWI